MAHKKPKPITRPSGHLGDFRIPVAEIDVEKRDHVVGETGNTYTVWCARCREWLPRTCFWKSSSRVTGYQSQCKECQKARRRDKYHSNEKYRRSQIAEAAAWNKRHPELMRKRSKEQRDKDPVKVAMRELHNRMDRGIDKRARRSKYSKLRGLPELPKETK